jgi:DMSO/TMAO reductase YedYZ molybdopterin-dependent catalytic subunit
MSISRRDLLHAAPFAAGLSLIPGRSSAQQVDPPKADAPFPGMIVRMDQPRNLETPLTAFQNGNVATEHFFVRSHFAVPTVDPKTFKLTVEGHVEKKLVLTLEVLKKMPTVAKSAVLECAGNGRVFLAPQARGLQWGNGGVGNAKWTGVPLGAVLELAGVKAGAGDVVLIGADSGAITSDPPSPGPIHFDRGIPLAKAKKDETLLVWDMNGEPLPASHGAPLRAIVGGWYGVASVKWLTRIVVLDRPHAGFWQTMDYAIWERNDGGLLKLVPVTTTQPKAIILSPAPEEVVKVGTDYTVRGLAWAGENAVEKVELSADGGKTWHAAEVGAKSAFSWSVWQLKWSMPKTVGTVKLLARCTDEKGNTQPEKRDIDRRTYMINHLVPTEIIVK